MHSNRSTMDLSLSSNERLYINKNKKFLFKFPVVKNLTSKFVKFYTFHVGFKKKTKDLLIIIFKNPAPVASVYSKTSTPSAPIIWDKKNNKGLCKILIINSGNANAHTGNKGLAAINNYTKKASKIFNSPLDQILVSSTGVIGEQIDPNKISKTFLSIKDIKANHLLSAAKSIITTDTYTKTILKKIKIKGKEIRIFGIAKGSGMISPNMGTMLAYIFIEANMSRITLKKILKENLDQSFNSITVDSDTSTSDTVMLFSLSDKNSQTINQSKDIKKISDLIKNVMFNLSIQVVSDGEGISKLIQVNITGAKTYQQATSVAFSIANSPLVKTAIAGEDANWGRVIMAIGKADPKINQNKIKLKFGNLLVACNGEKYNKIDLNKLDRYMKNSLIKINVNLGVGLSKRTVYASDLTHEYVKINADYRS